LNAGMDDYMTKPVDIPTLARALERWLPSALTLRRLADVAVDAADLDPTPNIDPAVLDISRLVDGFGSFDADARAFLAGFIDDTDRRIERVLDALTAEDATRAERETHALKGAARTVGAGRLADVCADIETMVCSGDIVLARMLGGALRKAAAELRSCTIPPDTERPGRAASMAAGR
jgi:two-component system, sensor histidine kinase and response regulator